MARSPAIWRCSEPLRICGTRGRPCQSFWKFRVIVDTSRIKLVLSEIFQIPPDLVVKSQPTDIIDIILCPIKRPNGVYMACRVRKSGGELLSIAEVLWSTTKSDGMRLRLVGAGGSVIEWLEFLDQWDPASPWHDRRVRLAANLALDKQGLCETVRRGCSRLTGSIIP